MPNKGGVGFEHKTAVDDAAKPAQTQVAEQQRSLFDLSTYLETEPLKSLFNRAGVNITERLEAARKEAKFWDERIPLITDDNYEDLIVEEKFSSLEEERDRVWFLVMFVQLDLFLELHVLIDEIVLFRQRRQKGYHDSWMSSLTQRLTSRKKIIPSLMSVGAESTT